MIQRIFFLASFLSALLCVKGQEVQKKLQTQLITAEAGEVIQLPEGSFHFDRSLSLDNKKNITIKGAGKDKTFLSFKGQVEGAEGLLITNCEQITVEGLTVQDAKGDGIKAMKVNGITFRDVRTEWTRKKPNKQNGAYGFYPVSCANVLIEDCEAIGASDAGIYVGQSHNIIVRRSRAYQNVAGIEIENSTMADVYECEAIENTGGILVFDLPDLPKKKGGNVRVYNNVVKENNYKNFAPKGNTVGKIPPGTGIMVLATSDVEVYGNQVTNNRTAGISIVSYYITEEKIKDKEYYPYPTAINIHDNTLTRKKGTPTWKNKLGFLLWLKFKRNVPNILYDGILDPNLTHADGNPAGEHSICIRNNIGQTFANIDAEGNFKNISRDLAPYDCEHPSLSPPSLSSND